MQLPDDMIGQRLDYALSLVTDYSRAHIQKMLKDGLIQVDRKPAKPSDRVFGGERITLPEPVTESLELEAEAIPLDILFEDEHLLVVNKAAGMVVHPSNGHDHGTLVHALLHHCPDLPGINGVERPGIVHRLDKDTSGSLVVAKTERAHIGLSALFSTHDIQREYLAWCKGAPPWQQRHIESRIGRHPQNRQKMAVLSEHSSRGRIAITDACREQVFDCGFSRMRLTLHTGRTHQIRVHLSHEHVPILADTLYGRSFTPSRHQPKGVIEALSQLHRQALHAEVLGFVHPVSDEYILCHAPLPQDLQQLDDALCKAQSEVEC